MIFHIKINTIYRSSTFILLVKLTYQLGAERTINKKYTGDDDDVIFLHTVLSLFIFIIFVIIFVVFQLNYFKFSQSFRLNLLLLFYGLVQFNFIITIIDSTNVILPYLPGT